MYMKSIISKYNLRRLLVILIMAMPIWESDCWTLRAQNEGFIVSGTVSDAMGPVMMANVIEIDGANRIISSGQTDMNGNFSFKIKDPKNKLKISFVGCKTKILPIKKEVYNIMLEDQTTLKEVTVVSKRRAGGSGLAIPKDQMSTANQSIDMKEFEGLAITSVDEALQGRIAGLDIVANSGNLGSGTSMRLRGVSSINSSSEPLIVVDGNVWQNDQGANSIDFSSANDEKFAELLNVNPEDIESISVLKDAAATAIWGSQGANGVIEIKTKRGTRGKTRVTYSYRLTGTWQPEGYKLLTGDEYTMLMKEAYFNPKLNNDASNIIEFNYDQSNPNGWNNYNKNTDWAKEVKQTGWRQNHYLSLTGGGEKAHFRIGAGYDHETGSIIKQQLDRLTSRVALDYFVSDRIKIVTNLAFTYTKNNKNYTDLLGSAYRRMPNTPVYEHDMNDQSTGYYYNLPTTISPELQDQVKANNSADQAKLMNPVAVANLAKSTDTSYKITPEFQLVYNLLGTTEGKTQLKYEGKIVFDIANNYSDSFLPSTLNVNDWTNEYNNKTTAYSYKSLGISTTHTLTFIPYFKNEDHSMMMMLRGQLNDGSSNNQTTTKYRQPNGINSTGTAGVISALSSGAGQWRSLYLTYSLHYAYKSRYMFDFSIRRDGSTQFGKDKRWGNFPALSLRWNVSKEPWFQDNVKWMSMLSIRPGWGIVGKQPGAEYLYFSTYSNGKGYLDYGSTNLDNIQLKNLKWEQKKTYNLGFDFGFFDEKINGNLEIYKQYTSDLLMNNVAIPTSSGFATLSRANVGKMENTGWEFNINSNGLIKFGKLGLDINVTFANNKNVITEMDESCLKLMNKDFSRRNGDYQTRVELNKPFGSIYGFKYLGVYQYTEYTDDEIKGVSGPNAPVVRDENGRVIKDQKGHTKPMMFCYGTGAEYEFQGGDAMYEDVNHDGNINELDIVYLGSALPKITGGFGIKFRLGRWSLNNQFNFRYGNKVINANRMNLENMYGNGNQSRAVNYRWRVEGDIASIPRALHQAGYNYLASDRFVEDGSFIRLNYSQISYSFPQKSLKKLGLTQLSFYVSANNLFCLTKYSGADPEVGYGSTGLSLDQAQTPRSKSFTGGITVQF